MPLLYYQQCPPILCTERTKRHDNIAKKDSITNHQNACVFHLKLGDSQMIVAMVSADIISQLVCILWANNRTALAITTLEGMV